MAEVHKHLIINVTVERMPQTPEELNTWLEKVVNKIKMNVFLPPMSRLCDTPGNEGITGVVVIDTSHCSIHFWYGEDVVVAKADLYSCKEYNVEDFIEMFNEFGLLDYNYMLIRRDNDINVVEEKQVDLRHEKGNRD